MDDLITRPYEPSDAEAVTDLINVIDEYAGGHPGFTVDDLRSAVDNMVQDRATDSRLVVTPAGQPVANAFVPTPPEGGFRVDLLGGVHPAWRGRGIGRELFGWQLARAAEIRAAAADSRPWELHAGTITEDKDSIRLYQRFDFTPVRYWFDMVADIATAPDLPVPDGLRAVDYSTEHDAVLYATHMEAFSDHWGYQSRPFDEWAGLSIRSGSFRPDLSVLGFDGDQLTGYVLVYGDADPTRIYIGQVGVRRSWRRRGLAAALLAMALRRAAPAGFRSASLGVDSDSPTGAVGVYERVGFTVEYRSVTYAKELP